MAFWLAEFLVFQLWGEQPKFPRRVVEAPWGIRYNDPGASYRHKSADVNIQLRINGQGMRADTDYGYEKPDGMIRIVSLGDSFTIGYEVDQEKTFSSVLEQGLRAAGYDAQVLNGGVSGFSTAEEVVYLERELIKYDPDLVVVTFFFNDFTDNVRTNLFRLGDEGQLVQKNDGYLPMGELANILNSNAIFNFLSAYSNAFVLAKERLTLFVKGLMVARNRGEQKKAAERELQALDALDETAYQASPYERQLLVGLLERLYAYCRERGIPVILQIIPGGGVLAEFPVPDFPLVDSFPYDKFDAERPGLALLPMIHLLRPHFGKEPLVHARSHRHWTPFAHRLSGEALARIMLDREFLPAPPSGSESNLD